MAFFINTQKNGFSLIEVLVSITVFCIIFMSSVVVLNYIIKASSNGYTKENKAILISNAHEHQMMRLE